MLRYQWAKEVSANARSTQHTAYSAARVARVWALHGRPAVAAAAAAASLVLVLVLSLSLARRLGRLVRSPLHQPPVTRCRADATPPSSLFLPPLFGERTAVGCLLC
ncbi:uncharacterized protein PG986_010971 [Apiospora aurea]|uniref:Uncharacterized protein n=1 Tax=Apiospora aurea TaxID=335848 RepID=A0ABR1Q3S7_9PEZI